MRFLIFLAVMAIWGFSLATNWDYVYHQDRVMQVDRVGFVLDRPVHENNGPQQLVVRWQDDKTVEAVTVGPGDYVNGNVNTFYIGKKLTNDPEKWRRAFWGDVIYYATWVLGAVFVFHFGLYIMLNMALTGRPFGY